MKLSHYTVLLEIHVSGGLPVKTSWKQFNARPEVPILNFSQKLFGLIKKNIYLASLQKCLLFQFRHKWKLKWTVSYKKKISQIFSTSFHICIMECADLECKCCTNIKFPLSLFFCYSISWVLKSLLWPDFSIKTTDSQWLTHLTPEATQEVPTFCDFWFQRVIMKCRDYEFQGLVLV